MFNILLGFPSKLLFVSVFFCIHCPDEKEANNKALLCFANYDLMLFWGFFVLCVEKCTLQYLCQHGIRDKLLGKIGTNQSSLLLFISYFMATKCEDVSYKELMQPCKAGNISSFSMLTKIN